jgi:uncharacterized protein (DUF4415 family)
MQSLGHETLRLAPHVIARFRATGPGWQSRINEVPRAHLPKIAN